MIARTLIAATAALAMVGPAFAQDADHPKDKTLVVGSDFGVAPWMVRGASGPEGFGVDMIKDIARRIGRPGVEIVDINFSGLFAALFSKRIEFTVNPLNITAERAERMLYTEPFFATGNGFLIRAADDMKGFEDLKGKQLAVNRGTISDTWATANAEEYGFEVQRYDTFPDSVQAVITKRAFTALNEIPTAVFAASQNKAIKVGFKDYNGRNFGYAFRLESVPYRNTVEEAIECMKLDGTLAKLHEKWYGSPPDQSSTINAVFVGYGAPGFKGYEFKPHVPNCK
jgi:polar amino acid transport system substrate-binding protein